MAILQRQDKAELIVGMTSVDSDSGLITNNSV